MNLLYVCIALLNTEAKDGLPEEPEGIASLVVQLISSLPYFTEKFENLSALRGLVRFFQSKEEGDADMAVSLLKHHWALPLESSISVEKTSKISNLAIKLPPGTRGVLKQGMISWSSAYFASISLLSAIPLIGTNCKDSYRELIAMQSHN